MNVCVRVCVLYVRFCVQQSFHAKVIGKLQECGVDLVMCQWGFDHELAYMLLEHGILAVKWIQGE